MFWKCLYRSYHKTIINYCKNDKKKIQYSYGGRYIVTMLPGVGIGPVLMSCVRDIFNHLGVPIDFEIIDFNNDTDLDAGILSIKRNNVGIVGNNESIDTMLSPYKISHNIRLRKELDLYVNLVHCKSLPNIDTSKYKYLDIVSIRHNLDGFLNVSEHMIVDGVVESLRIVTKHNSDRIVNFAFDYAKHNRRKHITIVHKTSDLKLSDELFLQSAKDISTKYPEIKLYEMNIDYVCMQLLLNPYQFDIILSQNIYGMCITNILCGLLGGPGVICGINYSDNSCVFEAATRNSGVDIANDNIANPIAIIHAGVELLNYLQQYYYAHIIRQAIYQTVSIDRIVTPDLGGHYHTYHVVDSIIKNIDYLLLNKEYTFN